MSSLDSTLSTQAGNVGPADERPLTPQEYQLLQRILSDPFSIPIQFKTWLVSYLETSDMSLPMSAVQGLTTILGISGVGGGTLGIFPAGIILPYGGQSAPAGSLMCDGAAYTRTTQQRLFDVIGTIYGAPDANTFNVPDIQERVPVGRGARAGYTTVGQSEGRGLGSRGLEHHHGTHQHNQAREVVSLNPGTPGNSYSITGSGAAQDGPLTAPAQIGSSGDTPNRPAFLVINFLIVA